MSLKPSLSTGLRKILLGVGALALGVAAAPPEPATPTVPPTPPPATPEPAPGSPLDEDAMLAAGVDVEEGDLLDIASIQENGKIRELLKDMGNLRLDDTARYVDNTLIEDGVCRAVFREGIVVPILSGQRSVKPRIVGFVFFGKGDLSMSFPDRADAIGFANHMVRNAKAKPEDYRAIAHGEKNFEDTFERAIVFTADRQMADVVLRLSPVKAGMVRVDRVNDPELRDVMESYVIRDNKGQLAARAKAADIFPERAEVLTRSGINPVDIIQYDRMVHDLLQTPWSELRFLAEFETKTRFHVANPTAKGDAKEDRWLTCFRDGADLADTGRKATAFAHGIHPTTSARSLARFASQPFHSNEPGTAPVPPRRIRAVDAEVKVDARPEKRMLYFRPLIDSTLTFEALEEGVQHLSLRLPADEATEGTFKLHLLTSGDGKPLDWMTLERTQPTRDELSTMMTMGIGSTGMSSIDGANAIGSFAMTSKKGAPMDLLVVLPKPLERGERVKIRLQWSAQWQFATFGVVEGTSGGTSTGGTDESGGGGGGGANATNNYRPLGITTGPRSFLPELLPVAGGTPWDFTTTVGIPPRRVEVAISGDTRREWLDEGGWRWQRSHGTDARRPSVALGRWRQDFDPAGAGLPAVRTGLFPANAFGIDTFGPEVRRILVFLKRFMPLPPIYEVDVIQDTTQVREERFREGKESARSGMVSISTIKVGDAVGARSEIVEENPFLAQSTLASQLTSQIWGQTVVPSSRADAWMVTAISDVFGMMYVRVALKEEGFGAFEQRLEAIRKFLEDPAEDGINQGAINTEGTRLSLTGRGSDLINKPKVYDDYAFYVIARMLRERIGDQAFFRGLDRFASRSPGGLVSTDMLQAAFEQASGQDLSEFFDYWIHGGWLPAIHLEYSLIPEPGGTVTVEGCVTTDVPFGAFDLPVGIWDPGKKTGVGGLIRVEDGRGVFVVENRPPDVEVETDPFGLVLAWRRTSAQVPETQCRKERGDRWANPTPSVFDTEDAEGRKKRRKEKVNYDRDAKAPDEEAGGAPPVDPLPENPESGRKKKK